MIGVDYDLFWTLNPKSLQPFIKAFNLKTQYDDSVAWQHGVYIRMAVSSIMSKQAKYPTRPFLSTKKIKKVSAKELQNDIKVKMMARMKLLNSRFTKGE